MSPLQKLTVVNVCHHVTLHGKVLRSIIIVISKIFIKLSVSKSILVHRKDILKKTKSVAIVNFYIRSELPRNTQIARQANISY